MRPLGFIPLRGSLVNRLHPLSRDLLAFWPLNEGTSKKTSGFAFDASGKNHHFDQWTSFVGEGSLWVGGNHKLGTVIEHSDTNRCYVGGSSQGWFDTSQPLTVVTWSRPISAIGNPVFQANVQDDFRLRIVGTPDGALRVRLGGVERDASTLVTGGLDTWNQCGVTFDGSQAHYYVNGEFSNSVTAAGSHTPTNTYSIPTGWRGKTACIGVWQRVLSTPEIAWLYHDPWAPFRGRWLTPHLTNKAAYIASLIRDRRF